MGIKENKNLCISRINIFKTLSRKVLEKIAEVHVFRDFKKGETIFTPHDEEKYIYLIEKGEVEIYQLSDEGKKIIIERLSPGGIFGNTSLAPDISIEVEDFADAISDVRLCVVKKSDFVKILKEYPEVALNLIQELGEKLNEADSKIRDLALANAEIKLIHELIRLSKKHGEKTNDSLRIEDRLTHEELAGMIGVSRETVTRAIQELKEKGIIYLDKTRHILINKRKAGEI